MTSPVSQTKMAAAQQLTDKIEQIQPQEHGEEIISIF